MKQFTIILLLVGCVYISSAKETIFVKYEPNSCVQQYYYKAADNTVKGLTDEYFDFHIKLNAQERTVVRTQLMGTYKKSEYALTNNIVNCENKTTHTFQSLTGQIANGEKEVYFIEEDVDNYHVYKGINAVYDIYYPKYFYSHSPDYAFRYVYDNNYKPSQKLKEDERSGVATMYAGKDKKGCNEQFGIVQMPEHACSTQVSKEYLRDIGLYIEKNDDGFFILKEIDHMELNAYLKWRCSGFRSDFDPNNPNPAPVQISTSNTYELLPGRNTSKGDARNVSQTAQGSLVIASYDKNGTAISDDNAIQGNTPKGENIIPQQYSETITSDYINTGDFVIAPYENGESAVPEEYNQPIENKVDNTKINQKHTVAKGETLYSLSKEYNVSVDDIKSWNKLSTNIIEVGDQLVVKKHPFVL